MRHVVRTRRAVLFAVPAALVLAAAAACSSSGTSTTSTSTGTTSGSSSSSTMSPSSAAALAVTTNSSLGQIVTTGSGRTVYRFDVDSASPSKSNCTGTCATYWPPVVVTGSGTPAVTGVKASLVGEFTRSDGSKQLTIAGWPVYTYAGDSGPGTASGQGLSLSGGKWWAVTPTGARAGGSSSPTGSSSTTSGNGGGNY